MTDIALIAKGLSKAQRSVVMSLPDGGYLGKAADARCARRMWWGIQKGGKVRLIEHQHLTDNSWCLNPLGLSVKSYLERNPND